MDQQCLDEEQGPEVVDRNLFMCLSIAATQGSRPPVFTSGRALPLLVLSSSPTSSCSFARRRAFSALCHKRATERACQLSPSKLDREMTYLRQGP